MIFHYLHYQSDSAMVYVFVGSGVSIPLFHGVLWQKDNFINKLYSMMKEQSCEICRRLGKTECGYHQFRNQFLSRFSKSQLQENQFAQTQSSINRNQQQNSSLTISGHTRTLTPTKITVSPSRIEQNRINFNYQQPQQTPFRQIVVNTPISHPQTRVYTTPPKIIQPIAPPPLSPRRVYQPPAQSHLIRYEGGQVLYYPIYPVYEVVYESVNMGSSLSPSRILHLHYYKMEDQLCVEIDIEPIEEEPPEPPKPQRVRNRRYKKMLQLREAGFFSEEAIKLRHPLLYHNYLGEHSQRSRATLPPETTLSEFLEKNLLNLEYRARLREELQAGDKLGASQEWRMEEQQPVKSQEDEKEFDPCQGGKTAREWELVEEEEIELQEQDLIDHAEQLFLEGKVDPNYVNYKEIDNNSALDELEQANLDAQEEYFREASSEEDAEINRNYYTGIQDF